MGNSPNSSMPVESTNNATTGMANRSTGSARSLQCMVWKADLCDVTIQQDLCGINVDDGTVICCTEAYMVLQMPADGQSTVFIHIKVDTGANGNITPLFVFQHPPN